jgi:transposase
VSDSLEARATDVEDLSTARALIATLQDQLTKSQREIAVLRRQLDVLCQRLFGRKSERVDARQLQLALEQLANEPGAVTEPIEMDSGDTPVRGHTRRRPTGRRPLPGHLPRRRIEIDVPEADKHCACGHLKTRMGESVTEKLEYEPASFTVIETVRAKYACPHCHAGVVEAPAPPQAIEKGLAGEGLLAHVVVSKYVDHLPLYREDTIRRCRQTPHQPFRGRLKDRRRMHYPEPRLTQPIADHSAISSCHSVSSKCFAPLARAVRDSRSAVRRRANVS